MKRSGPLRRSPLARGRTRLPARSPKREAAQDTRWDVKQAVLARDGHRCRMASGLTQSLHSPTMTPHHLRKEGQCGPYTLENLICLCATCNGWVEDNPDSAHRLGLVQRAGDTPADVWHRLFLAGLAASPVPGSPPNLGAP